MSDYEREKVLRVPLDKYFPNMDRYEFEDEYIDIFKEGYGKSKDYFTLSCTESNFLDYVLYASYGIEYGDYGHARLLTETEKEKYKPVFEKIIHNINMDDVHYVDYCFYNCCEAPDYYEIEEI